MVKAKKHLGQHFLNSPSAIKSIVESADLKKDETVLEIGPGKGVLTKALLESGARVVTVEKDREMIEILSDKFSSQIKNKQLILIQGDILDLKTENLLPAQAGKLKTGFYKLVANIPYYITGEILRKFIGGKIKPSLAVLLVQKEVADRIIAHNKKESVLSISIKIFGMAKIVKKVPAGAFNPPPKVDSAILLIENIASPFKNETYEEKFFQILKTGFAHKRKILLGNLKEIRPEEKIMKSFKSCGLGEKIRAENLSLEDWKKLYASLGF